MTTVSELTHQDRTDGQQGQAHDLSRAIKLAQKLATKLEEVDQLHQQAASELQHIRTSADAHRADIDLRVARQEQEIERLTERCSELEDQVEELRTHRSPVASGDQLSGTRDLQPPTLATPPPDPPARATRKVRSADMVAFGEALGVDLEGWALVDLLDSLRAYGEVGGLSYPGPSSGTSVEGMPTGWSFGPASENYLATGQWES